MILNIYLRVHKNKFYLMSDIYTGYWLKIRFVFKETNLKFDNVSQNYTCEFLKTLEILWNIKTKKNKYKDKLKVKAKYTNKLWRVFKYVSDFGIYCRVFNSDQPYKLIIGGLSFLKCLDRNKGTEKNNFRTIKEKQFWNNTNYAFQLT